MERRVVRVRQHSVDKNSACQREGDGHIVFIVERNVGADVVVDTEKWKSKSVAAISSALVNIAP